MRFPIRISICCIYCLPPRLGGDDGIYPDFDLSHPKVLYLLQEKAECAQAPLNGSDEPA